MGEDDSIADSGARGTVTKSITPERRRSKHRALERVEIPEHIVYRVKTVGAIEEVVRRERGPVITVNVPKGRIALR